MPTPPPTTHLHHLAVTATDVERSVTWWRDVFGYVEADRGPHDGGFGVLLQNPGTDLVVVVHHHDANDGAPFSERRTGLDHVGIAVPTRAALDAWERHLTALGVEHSPPEEIPDYGACVLVLRDPDNLQIELVSPAG